LRQDDKNKIYVLFNLSDHESEITIPDGKFIDLLNDSHEKGGKILLRALSAKVLLKN